MTSTTAGRLAWSLWAVAFVEAVAAVVFFALSVRIPTEVYGYRGLAALIAVTFATVGAVVASSRREHPLGWLFLVIGVLIALQSFGQEYGVYAAFGPAAPLPGATIALWLNNWMWVTWVFPIGTFGLLLFPDGRLPSPRWRPVLWLSAVAIAVESAALALKPGPLEAYPQRANPVGITVLRAPLEVAENVAIMLLMLCLLLSVASAIVRRRRADPETRARLRWFLLGGSLIVGALFLNIAESYLPERVPGVAVFVAVGLFPVVLGMGILRYRLFDIDLVIRKTVVYAVLAVVITVVYLLLVVALPSVVFGFGADTGFDPVQLAFVFVAAVAFQPLRERARRLANRLVYGRRATPYEVLSEFSERVGGTFSTEDVLPRMARLVVESTGATRVVVWLRVRDEWRVEARWPAEAPVDESSPETSGDRVFPVGQGDESLGAITVAKPPSDPMTEAEERLLEDLATQAGLVLRNVQLTEDLRANLQALRESRQRLVTAQDAERRRLERDIHDGAQQHLVALAVKLRLLEGLIAKDPDRAAITASELKGQAGEALETLRELARGIYPPLLADQGLAAALEAQARRAPVAVTVHPDGIDRYPQEIEAAVYFCTLEALQNVAKYAEATRVDLTLRRIGDTLEFELRDDGRGFDPATTPRGSGLQNMTDRLDALGGSLEVASKPGAGTTVTGRVPVAGR
jgi:signal transduction histidine kinase